MKLRGWWIDGFGHFCDYGVSGLGDGLTVFHGPNEAGKSTLLAFVRGMLFGFPDRRSRDARYEPLNGGRHGGRLMMEVDGERWTLEREAGARGGGLRLSTPRGDGEEDELRHALGSADARLFRSVFAFSLTELQSFETLSDDAARSRIFSAGIVGAGRAARQVISELGDSADALFKPRGRTQVIPVLLRRLAEHRQSMAEARRAARMYPDLLREAEACLEEKQRLDAALVVAQRGARHFDGLLNLWSIWHDLHEAEAQYGQLEAVDTFPIDPERQLADAIARREAARARAGAARLEAESAEERVASLRGEVRANLAALAPDVVAHHESRNLHQNNVARLQTARVDLMHATEACDRALGALGGSWNEERLLAFDASLPQRDRIRSWSDRLRKASDDVQSAEREHSAITDALGLAERELATAAELFDAAPKPDPEQVERREASLRRLRARLADRRDKEHEAARLHAVWEERSQMLRLLEAESRDEREAAIGPEPDTPSLDFELGTEPEPGTDLATAITSERGPDADVGGEDTRTPDGSRLVPIAAAAFGLLAAGALAFVRPWLAIIVAIFAVVTAVAAAAWLRRARLAAQATAEAARRASAERVRAAERAASAARAAAAGHLASMQRALIEARRTAADHLAVSARDAEARRRTLANRLEVTRAQVAEALDAMERARRDVAGMDVLIASDAAAAGVSEQPTPADLDATERTLARQHQEAERADQFRRALSEATARRDGLRDQEVAAVRRLETLRAAFESGRTEWLAWARAERLPEGMSPESALDFVPAIQQARELVHARDKLRALFSALESEVEMWEERARQLLSRAEVRTPSSLPGHVTLVEALHALHAECVADSGVRAKLTAAEDSLQACQRKLEMASAELAQCQAACDALLVEAGARDEADYTARMQTFAERQRLRREIERLRRQLDGRIGEGTDDEMTRAALATGTVAEWERERERHERDAALLSEQLEQAIRSHQDAQRRQEAAEMSADIPRYAVEEQALLAELNAAADRWRTVTLARVLTDVTWREYVRTRQPAVIANASEMFAAVTGGAYTELQPDDSGEELSVVTRRGAVLNTGQLSRGTAEQLYLCLRLGLAAEFGAHGAQLPLIMDDVCVNFDPERARAVASVLCDYATGQQVIFFTCHPSTVAMLRDLHPGLDVHEMPRFGSQGGR